MNRKCHFLCEKEWFKRQYEKEIGPPSREKDMDMKIVINELKAKARQRNIRIKGLVDQMKLESDAPQIKWNSQPTKTCSCPTTKCICKGNVLEPPLKIPEGKLQDRKGIKRRLRKLIFWKPVKARRPAGTFIPRFLAAAHTEAVLSTATLAHTDYGKLQPEYCMSGCYNFYVCQKLNTKIDPISENMKIVQDLPGPRGGNPYSDSDDEKQFVKENVCEYFDAKHCSAAMQVYMGNNGKFRINRADKVMYPSKPVHVVTDMRGCQLEVAKLYAFSHEQKNQERCENRPGISSCTCASEVHQGTQGNDPEVSPHNKLVSQLQYMAEVGQGIKKGAKRIFSTIMAVLPTAKSSQTTMCSLGPHVYHSTSSAGKGLSPEEQLLKKYRGTKDNITQSCSSVPNTSFNPSESSESVTSSQLKSKKGHIRFIHTTNRVSFSLIGNTIMESENSKDEVSSKSSKDKLHKDKRSKNTTATLKNKLQQSNGEVEKTSDVTRETSDFISEISDITRKTSDVTKETSDVAKEISDFIIKTSDITGEISDVTKETSDVTRKISDGTRVTSEDRREKIVDTNENTNIHIKDVSEQTIGTYYSSEKKVCERCHKLKQKPIKMKRISSDTTNDKLRNSNIWLSKAKIKKMLHYRATITKIGGNIFSLVSDALLKPGQKLTSYINIYSKSSHSSENSNDTPLVLKHSSSIAKMKSSIAKMEKIDSISSADTVKTGRPSSSTLCKTVLINRKPEKYKSDATESENSLKSKESTFQGLSLQNKNCVDNDNHSSNMKPKNSNIKILETGICSENSIDVLTKKSQVNIIRHSFSNTNLGRLSSSDSSKDSSVKKIKITPKGAVIKPKHKRKQLRKGFKKKPTHPLELTRPNLKLSMPNQRTSEMQTEECNIATCMIIYNPSTCGQKYLILDGKNVSVSSNFTGTKSVEIQCENTEARVKSSKKLLKRANDQKITNHKDSCNQKNYTDAFSEPVNLKNVTDRAASAFNVGVTIQHSKTEYKRLKNRAYNLEGAAVLGKTTCDADVGSSHDGSNSSHINGIRDGKVQQEENELHSSNLENYAEMIVEPRHYIGACTSTSTPDFISHRRINVCRSIGTETFNEITPQQINYLNYQKFPDIVPDIDENYSE